MLKAEGTGAVVRAVLAPEKHHPEVARAFATALPRRHITGKWLGNSVAAQAWTNYLGLLDYDRAYFHRSDIDEFRRFQQVIDDNLRKGDVSFAYSVFDIFKKSNGLPTFPNPFDDIDYMKHVRDRIAEIRASLPKK